MSQDETIQFETIGRPTQHQIEGLMRSGATVLNRQVRVERYRVTIERIEEPKEVIKQRLEDLLGQRLHMDNRAAVRAEAKRLGITLER